jgi:plasmid stabilization system protein ParE
MQDFALHPEADIDLTEILDYLEDESPAAADLFLDRVESTLLSLVRFPHQGYRRPNLTSLPLRFKLVGEYVIAYAPDSAPLWVVAVFHGRRSPRVIAAMLRSREQ